MTELADVPWNLILPLLVLQFIRMVVALIDVIRNKRTNGPYIMWILIIIFGSLAGSIIYFRLWEEKRLNILLDVKKLTKNYGQETATDTISFSLEEHTSTALIGPNGAGKTTTLSMLAGLVSPTSGAINFNNDKTTDIREIIGFLPQYPKFFPWLSALEFTEMAARLSGVEAKKSDTRGKENIRICRPWGCNEKEN